MKQFALCFCIVLVLTVFTTVPLAQEKYDPANPLNPQEQALEIAKQKLSKKLPDLLRPDAVNSLKEPSFTPSSKQVDAPSSANVSTNILDKAAFTELLSVALDNGLTSESGDRAFTLNLNMFGFVAAKDPSILENQEKYEKHRHLRKLSGAITFGEAAVDTSAVDSLTSVELTDVITVRARVRILGSRDRRDYWQEYKDGTNGLQDQIVNDIEDLVQQGDVAADIVAAAGDKQKEFEAWLRAYLEYPELTAKLISTRAAYLQKLSELNNEIDHSFLLTFDVAGEFRDRKIGKDRFMGQLIAEKAGAGIDFGANVEYTFEEFDGGDLHDLKFGFSISDKLLRGSPVNPEGFDASLGVAGMVRNEDRANLFKFNLKIQVPTGTGLALPLGLTWTRGSRDDEENGLQVNFGMGYDLAALWQ